MEGHDLGAEIRGVVKSLERNNPDLSASARVKRAWNASVDPQVKEHVTAVFVVPNTAASEVVIYVDSAIWATELNMQVELLRLNLNMELAKDAHPNAMRTAEQVESLKFVVSKEQYMNKKHRLSTFQMLEEEEHAMSKVQPVALSDDEMTELQIAASQVENDALRDIAYAAAKANLEWQKGLKQAI